MFIGTGLAIIGATLRTTAALMRHVGKMSGLTEEDLAVERIKAEWRLEDMTEQQREQDLQKAQEASKRQTARRYEKDTIHRRALERARKEYDKEG